MNLREFATRLGLSQTTVSRALNDYPEVSEATRARVKAAADKYGYRANSRAKSLATGRSMTIGHVLDETSKDEMVNPIFGDFLAGASESYTKRGYDLLLSRSDHSDIEASYKALIAKGNVDGIVLQSPAVNDPRIKILAQMGIPFVVHGRSSEVQTPYAWVDVNNRRAFMRATLFLAELGHERIALINGDENLDFAYRRRLGYLDGLKEAGLVAREELMFSSDMTEVFGHHVTRDLIQTPSPPTAFLVSSLISAIGVRRAIEEAGLRMGKEISVIIHDDELSYLRNGQSVPIFTATRSSVRQAGALAAELLMNRIEQPQGIFDNQLLEAELVLGRSTGPNLRGINNNANGTTSQHSKR